MVPLPLARGDFFALPCCCPAGARVMLLLALAAALVSWPLAWVFRLEVPPGALPCVVADVGKVCAEGCVRPGSGPAEAQLASWPWPQARRRARRPQVPGPQCPQCAHSSNSSGPHHPSHNHARGWQGMCAGLLGDTWRGTQWLAAAISLCRSIACMASFPAHHRWPQGASFRTRYPKRASLKGGFSPGGARGGVCKPKPRQPAALGAI